MTLISQTRDVYYAVFTTDMAPRLFQAPGRVNLIGEHTDYNAGDELPAAIEVAVGFMLLKLSESEINLKDLALAAQSAENDEVRSGPGGSRS